MTVVLRWVEYPDSTAKVAHSPGVHSGAARASSGHDRVGSVTSNPTTSGAQPMTSRTLVISAT